MEVWEVSASGVGTTGWVVRLGVERTPVREVSAEEGPVV